jgi:endonuclease G
MPRRRNKRNATNYDPLIDSALSAFQRLDPRSRAIVAILLLAALIVAAAVYVQSHRAARTTAPQASSFSPQLLLGNPSSATSDPAARANYLMVKPWYALSYNDALGTANWVSWRVTVDDLGNAPRKPTFDTDTTLPPGFYHVTHKDYSGSGFDRGHLCPHSDRAANQAMSFATFCMTNIIPQAPNVNQKAWAQLENYCRDLVREHQHLYIIAGPAGRGGTGSDGFKNSIASGKVTVPAQCWKIIVIVPEAGDDDLSKISSSTRVITVIMPNDNSAVGEDWAKFRTTPAEIESQTGLKFFDKVSDSVAQILRQKQDREQIAPPRPFVHTGG